MSRQRSATILKLATMLAVSILPALAVATAPCGEWHQVVTLNVGNDVNRLTSVSALSPADAWAVGHWRDQPTGAGPLAMRWNGAVWGVMDLPATSHLGTMPQTAAVATSANGDVWILGDVTTTYPTYNLPLVLRWRGGAWDVVETVTLRPQTVYPFAARGGRLLAADGVAADDIWAVGQAAGFGDAGATSAPLAVHWDGANWTEVDVPRVANRHHELSAVVAIAPDDAWAVGDYRNVADAFRGVTYHWDGSSWSHVVSPVEAMSGGLEDVAATGPDDVWALGNGDSGVVVMHWDGDDWSLVAPPANSGGSIAAVGPDDVWVSGWNGHWHWDGAAWTEVPATVPGAAYVVRSGGMEILGDCDLWCVGFSTAANGITSFTLAERLQARLTDGPAPVGSTALVAAPNPFNPRTSIRYDLPLPGAVSLHAYDLRGHLVRTFAAAARQESGAHEVAWDGADDRGSPLPSGTYLLRLQTGGTTRSLRVALIR